MKKRCATCGKSFETTSNRATYCSDECRKVGVAEKQKGSIRFIFKVESTGETPVDLSGNSAEPELIIGEVGTSYSYTPPTINGYIYDKPEAGKYLNGIFSKESANNTENIILYYKKPTP